MFTLIGYFYSCDLPKIIMWHMLLVGVDRTEGKQLERCERRKWVRTFFQWMSSFFFPSEDSQLSGTSEPQAASLLQPPGPDQPQTHTLCKYKYVYGVGGFSFAHIPWSLKYEIIIQSRFISFGESRLTSLILDVYYTLIYYFLKIFHSLCEFRTLVN